MTSVDCPICRSGRSAWYATIDGHPYFTCGRCDSIHIDPAVIDMLDRGGPLVGDYAEGYWGQERVGAIERAAGSRCAALARRSGVAGARKDVFPNWMPVLASQCRRCTG